MKLMIPTLEPSQIHLRRAVSMKKLLKMKVKLMMKYLKIQHLPFRRL